MLKFPFKQRTVKVVPVLEGRLIRLGVSPELDDERERIELLSLFRREVPQLYRLRSFLLSTPPAGSAEPYLTEEVRWLGFADWLVKGQSDWYQVQVGENGAPTCTCPDFTHRRRGRTWCKHIVGLHQVLQRALQPKEGFQLLPAWRVREKTAMAELVEMVGGLFEIEQAPLIYQASYSRKREQYDAPMLGVEFEVPLYREEELDHLRKVLTLLRRQGIVLTYEYDASVDGGEIKFVPFPATLEKVNEVAVMMEGIKALYPRLFERGGYAGIHVHINVYPLNLADRSYVNVGTWFRKNFDLPKIFGRSFNRYAKEAVSRRDRYSWLNLTNLPETVEVRLGSAYGEPRKILYGALLLQRVIWAKKDGFRLPNRASQRFEKLLNLFSDEEKKVMAPFLREHLVPARGD